MNFEEFIRPTEEASQTEEKLNSENEETSQEEQNIDLDVQKAVVESLAADKAEQNEKIVSLEKENASLKSENNNLKSKIEILEIELAKTGDMLAMNSDTSLSNKVALLDRDVEIFDRYEGEARDHVLEVLKEARDVAEKEGRLRRAQILESVLVANIPTGSLEQKRKELEKIFNDNQNILSGPVINELDKLNISYKVGENYLLPCEILKRTF